MNYIVYDTEFNQPQPKLYNPNSRFRPNQLCPFEIIEIGAAKVSENLEITDSFSRLVKPVIYRRLSPIVIRKTGIKPTDLKDGDGFSNAIADFREFCGKDFLLCTWSTNDVRILQRNCIYHKLPFEWLGNYLDIQKQCTKVLGLPKSQAVGLKNALRALNIKVDGRLHRAMDDAIHSAKIFIEVFSDVKKEQISEKQQVVNEN
ncbi:MAG TPA: exonuclease [Clostridiales bacterium]|nr:exonuclease domain-containing protein [Clostridia bacterium]HCS72296.1 exonuclease [Clostridiales bacterium]